MAQQPTLVRYSSRELPLIFIISGLSRFLCFYSVSQEEDLQQHHTISPDGYDVGRCEPQILPKKRVGRVIDIMFLGINSSRLQRQARHLSAA